jgi:hypothetical protein
MVWFLPVLDKIEKILWQNYITSKDVTTTSVEVGGFFSPLVFLMWVCGKNYRNGEIKYWKRYLPPSCMVFMS